MPPRVLIVGTGLIGASLGRALKSMPEPPEIAGWDPNPQELATALRIGALDRVFTASDAVLNPEASDIWVLAAPVLPILDWMERLAPVLREDQLVTDVGSTKLRIVEAAKTLFPSGRAHFLPGHPMAGKESGGAALADRDLFRGAPWLFSPQAPLTPLALHFRHWVEAIGARPREIEAREHDRLCAWVSHLPQMLSTALAATLEDTFAADPEGRAAVEAIGGRALRETTRLGSSPYSMWRDIALTNADPLAATLFALEQRLAHLRENLKTPELRSEFATANRFRAPLPKV